MIVRPDGCEVIIWHEGSRRCELWTVQGASELRIYAATRLLYSERPTAGSLPERAEALRGLQSPPIN